MSAEPWRAGGSMARILVVEDQEKHRDSLRRGLEAEGYEVITASTGDEGFEAATTRAVDAIVLDLMLPGLANAERSKRGNRAQGVRCHAIAWATWRAVNECGQPHRPIVCVCINRYSIRRADWVPQRGLMSSPQSVWSGPGQGSTKVRCGPRSSRRLRAWRRARVVRRISRAARCGQPPCQRAATAAGGAAPASIFRRARLCFPRAPRRWDRLG